MGRDVMKPIRFALAATVLVTAVPGAAQDALDRVQIDPAEMSRDRITIAGGVGTLLSGRSRLAALTSGGALATASALTRAGIVEAGIESAEDPKYTVRVQKDRLEARRSKGVVDDSIGTYNLLVHMTDHGLQVAGEHVGRA